MKPLLSTAGVCALAFMLAAPVSAQVTATIVLRSGERVTGEVVDLNARGLSATVRGSERVWPLSDVSVIDFAGNGQNFPAGEVTKIGSRHLLVLRNGAALSGRFIDVGGRNPLRITFDSGGGTKDYSSTNVARIYVSTPPGSGAAADVAGRPLAAGTGTLQVSAREGWISTGLQVMQGEIITVASNGEVRLSRDANDMASPAGSLTGRRAPGAPMPNELAGALIGRIGNGQPFGIGNQPTFPAQATGMLYVAVNDGDRNDNSGAFGVTVGLQDPTRRNRRR